MKFRLIEELFVAPVSQDYSSGIAMKGYQEGESLLEEKKEVLNTILHQLHGEDYLMDNQGTSLLLTNSDFNYYLKMSLKSSLDDMTWCLHLERIPK